MKRLKKGFTIVELVIVIAVIAILTAVLVPTFISLSKKGKDTLDKNIVTNANIQLAASESLEGKNRSMSEAVKDVDQIGYHMSTVQTNNGNMIVWDQVNDRFVLLDKDGNVILKDERTNVPSDQNKLFYPIEKLSDRGEFKFAIYAKELYEGPTSFTSATSFDAGEKEGIESISYAFTSNSEVLVVTNSEDTTLNVDAPNADFKHVGLCGKIDIEEVADDSFNDHGHVGYVEIDSGHFVADKGSNIKAVYATSDSAKVDKQNGGQIENAYGGAASYTGDNSKGNVELDFNDNKAAVEEQALEDLDHEINPVTVVVEEIGTWAQLIAFTERDDERTGIITSDIDFEMFPLEIKGNKTIDLNGHTLSLANGTYDSKDDLDEGCLIYVGSDAELTLDDSSGNNSGEIKYKSAPSSEGDDDKGTFLICNKGLLTINGGTYTGAKSTFQGFFTVSHGVLLNYTHAIINGGNFIIKSSMIQLVNEVFINGFNKYWVTEEDTKTFATLEVLGGTFTNENNANGIVRNYVHKLFHKAAGVVLGPNGQPYDSTKIYTCIPDEYATDGVYTMDPQSGIRCFVEEQEYTTENNYTIRIIDNTSNNSKIEWIIVKSDNTYTVSHQPYVEE